ncbi:MAG: hypothetical protein LBP96_00070 [Bacteroidales bacterium]|jgi:Spy/CpxP family protein refolding chaperone|nr:hypothetical protein [Bacteroidales bacterium]
MDRTKILLWIIGLLVMLNASTIATILYRNSQTQIHERTVVIETGTISLSEQYLCEMLGLCANQKCEFCPKHKVFKKEAGKIVADIDKRKAAMFEQMQQAKPNVEELNKLSEEIGELHAELKKNTAKFYLKIVEICCTPTQKEKVNEIFEPLFKDIVNKKISSK